MELKRIYDKPEGWEPEWKETLLPDGSPYRVCTNPPPVKHLEIRHTGFTRGQNFSGRIVLKGSEEGWITVKPGKVIIHAEPEDLEYTILRSPGRYCCHCDEKLPDDATGAIARAHVAAMHPGVASPDPQNPSGYCMLNHYETELGAEQHDRWRVRHDPKTKRVIYPRASAHQT